MIHRYCSYQILLSFITVTILLCCTEHLVSNRNIPYFCYGLQQPATTNTIRSTNIQIRPVISMNDINTIRSILFKEYMNPLSISHQHLLVAYSISSSTCSSSNGATLSSTNSNSKRITSNDVPIDAIHSEQPTIVGFGQLRPLNHPIEKDQSNNNNNNNKHDRLQQQQQQQIQYMELASIYVLPQYRHQGIATKIILSLLSRQQQQQQKMSDTNQILVCILLTLRTTIPLYTPHGFRVVENPLLDAIPITRNDYKNQPQQLPLSFKLEYILGTIISKVLGNDLVCMIRT